MSAQAELQSVIYGYFGPTTAINAWRTPEQQDRELAAAILAAGYSKPKVIGYVVVGHDGGFVRDFGLDRPAAQAFADEWTEDSKSVGMEWEYRVAEIVEPTK